jgi:hypothetical protein
MESDERINWRDQPPEHWRDAADFATTKEEEEES